MVAHIGTIFIARYNYITAMKWHSVVFSLDQLQTYTVAICICLYKQCSYPVVIFTVKYIE